MVADRLFFLLLITYVPKAFGSLELSENGVIVHVETREASYRGYFGMVNTFVLHLFLMMVFLSLFLLVVCGKIFGTYRTSW